MRVIRIVLIDIIVYILAIAKMLSAAAGGDSAFAQYGLSRKCI
jgi:hypothetical protein